jgi:hypothetical protein
MKKLAFFFTILISLLIIAGCNNSKKTVTRFSANGKVETAKTETTTTVTKIDEKKPEVSTPILLPKTKFAITSSKEKMVVSDQGYHLIQGTTPKNTAKIVVNNYPLSKYRAGDTKWSYIAAVSLGTLKKGANDFNVRALDAKGKELASEKVTIVYKGAESGVLAGVGSGLTPSILITILSVLAFYGFRRRPQLKIVKI